MTPQRWARVKEVFGATFERPEAEWTAFLDSACDGDAQLRGEVERLLAESDATSMHSPAGGFLNAAAELAPGDTVMALQPSTRLGPYEIIAAIGAGGMGEVYRARDSRLKREVAIKVLPVSFACDPDRIARFEREARAASALNHPNIVSVYDIGRENNTCWIVSELVDGETLRRSIDHGPLPARKAAEIAVQIADGLAAAHAAGIVHRDLKPGNIMFTRSGRVKILDFGLAKREHLATDSNTRELTNEGTVLGTAGYMSPEQVRGEDVDYRSDIFSFGVILYEMLAGKQAFNGSSSIEVMNAILKDDPPELPPSVPPGLERIVRRCLEKDAVRRFQSAADLGFALTSVSAPQPASAAARKNLVWRTWGIVAAASVAGALVALVWFILHRPPKPSAQVKLKAPAELTQKRLTFNSSEYPVQSSAISPDGKYLAYSDPAGIHVKLLSTSEERLIPRPAGVPASAAWVLDSWFPDGTQLLADVYEPGGQKSIWTVSVLGQSPRALREGASGYEVSPDGTHIAFSPLGTADDVRELWMMGSLGDNPQKVIAVGENEALGSLVHWSPDGQRLAYIREQQSPDRSHWIETCDLKGESRPVVVLDPDLGLKDLSWLPDGRIAYASGTNLWQIGNDYASGDNLWEIGVDQAGKPSGKPKRITQWVGSNLRYLSASADGKRLVFQKSTDQAQVYLGELAAGGTRMNPPRRLTNDETSGQPTAWMLDSKAVLLDSNRNGTRGIFKQVISQETSEPVVTGPQWAAGPRLSADGAWILYFERPRTPANPAPADRLMRIPASGGVPQMVMETRNWRNLLCARAPASLCVIFETSLDRKQLTITAFEPVKGRGKVLRTMEMDPSYDYEEGEALSPDGSRLAFSLGGQPEIHIRLLSLSSGSESEITVKGWPNITGMEWAPDGKGFYCGSVSPQYHTLLYVDMKGNARVLWQYRGGGGEIWALPSPDGRYLAIRADVTNSNVWMVEGF